MKKLIAAISMVLITASAFAGTITNLDWSAPTTYTDGTPLDQSKLSYAVSCGSAAGTYTISSQPTATTTMGLATIITATTGNAKYYCAAQAMDGFGIASDYSNEVSLFRTGSTFLSAPPKLSAPAALHVR